MATQRCNSDEAFNILRTVSQHRNIPIRQVTADLVAKTIENHTPPDHPQTIGGTADRDSGSEARFSQCSRETATRDRC